LLQESALNPELESWPAKLNDDILKRIYDVESRELRLNLNPGTIDSQVLLSINAH